jgi:hypothetical protein
LKGWGYNIAGDRKKRKQEIQDQIMRFEEMEEAGPISTEQISEKIDIKIELMNILDEEEVYWFRRCQENWLLKGDNNTEFFHRVANGRKRKQTIYSLNDGERVISGDEELLNHATAYYKTLFDASNGNAFELDHELWPDEEKVSIQENLDLVRGRGDKLSLILHGEK